jgi:hypothetical protein
MRSLLPVLAAAGTVACRMPLDELDGAFYAWDDRTVHCAVEVDDRAGYDVDDVLAAMDRARERGEVVELLVHIPGVTISWDHLEALLAGARDRGLPFLTMTELLRGEPQAGVSLQYDDWRVDQWTESAPLLARYDARVTIFVARYQNFRPTARLQLAALAAAGHDVEAHSVKHVRDPAYVEQHGVRAYLDDEVLPSIEQLRDDGYEVVSYAYPFGAHTGEIDRAVLGTGQVEVVRALAKPNELRANPCAD